MPTVSRAALCSALSIAMLLGVVRAVPVTAAGSAGVVVPTQHNDNQRTGANLAERVLTPQLVQSNGLRGVDRSVDGMINTQILYAHGVMVNGTPRNVAFVTTSANSVYAYDADVTTSGKQDGLLWRTGLVDPAPAVARGISATPVLEFANGSGTIDVLYSTATNPVSFPNPGGGTFSLNIGYELVLRNNLKVHFYLVKLDLATGKPVGSPAEIRNVSMLRDDGVTVPFDPIQENDVASLLLDHGYLYVSFSARQSENASQYYGWMLRYKAADLSYAGAFNTAPHAYDWKGAQPPAYYPGKSRATGTACYGPSGWVPPPPEPSASAVRRGTIRARGAAAQPVGRLAPWDPKWPGFDPAAVACTGEGGGIWQGGAGPAADRDGNVYVMIGNAHYDPAEGSYGDSIVRLHSKGGGSSPADFGVDGSWAPPAEVDTDEQNDVDLGSAGPMVVESAGGARRVLVGGKTGVFYVVDGQLTPKQSIVAGRVHGLLPISPANETWMRYQTWEEGPHLHGSPTLWRVSPTKAYVYEWAEKDVLKKYEFDPSQGRFTHADPKPWSAEAKVLAPPCVLDFLKCLTVMPGGMLALSADGTNESSGVVWAIVHGYFPVTDDGIYAFDAKTLQSLWFDKIGSVPHFAGPTVADGHVFVPTNSMQWRFTIYSPGASRAVRSARRNAPPPPFAKPLAALANARAMAMTRSHSGGISVPNYAADPAYRARLSLSQLTRALPPGTIVGASYIALGTDTYQCPPPTTCTTMKTDITRIASYDDRSGVGREIQLTARCSYATNAGAPVLPTLPHWQFLEKPCPVFGSASHVGRAWSVFLRPVTAPRARSFPFVAVYYGLQQGAM
jgi:hypothetical protein